MYILQIKGDMRNLSLYLVFMEMRFIKFSHGAAELLNLKLKWQGNRKYYQVFFFRNLQEGHGRWIGIAKVMEPKGMGHCDRN